MRKVISVILSILIVIGIAVPSAVAYTGSKNVNPIISVEGRSKTNPIYSGDGEQIFPVELDMGYIVKEALKYPGELIKGVITGNYDEWTDKITGIFAPMYEKLIFDENGEIIDKQSEVKFEYDHDNPERYDHYNIDYRFLYDWRMDPMSVADDLDEYIDCVIKATGQSKVCLTGRCYGANIISAYLYKYGCDKIDTTVYYAQIATGSFMAEMTFAGKFALDLDAVEYYLENSDNSLTDDAVSDNLLASAVAYLNTLKALNLPAKTLKKISDKLYPELAPKLMPAMFATFPSMWSMISDENYEYAKNLIFGKQQEKYKGLIEKIDNYHYNVQVKLVDILKDCQKKGMNLGVITKYNIPNPPIYENSIENGDNVVLVKDSSFGALAADYGKTFSDKQLENANMKYVSSDHIIDAETCAFRDYTWFIKDCPHSTFPLKIDTLIRTICNYKGQMTIDDNEKYPQFLKFYPEDRTLTPLTDVPEVVKVNAFTDHFVKYGEFIKAIFSFIKNIFTK